MKPLFVHPVVYVLELEGDSDHPVYFYIGASLNLNARMAQHFTGQGAKFCKKHAPKRIREVIWVEGEALDVEDATTMRYIQEYGAERVRGGRYC